MKSNWKVPVQLKGFMNLMKLCSQLLLLWPRLRLSSLITPLLFTSGFLCNVGKRILIGWTTVTGLETWCTAWVPLVLPVLTCYSLNGHPSGPSFWRQFFPQSSSIHPYLVSKCSVNFPASVQADCHWAGLHGSKWKQKATKSIHSSSRKKRIPHGISRNAD